jgi:hypothetical protein
MRDFDRVREKIEIRLEPRQLVWLAVVTALFCGGLFGGGYLLGSRNGANTGGAALDRLAAIDAFAGPRADVSPAAAPGTEALGEVEFMFPSALGERPARPRPAAKPVRLPQLVVSEPGVALPESVEPEAAPLPAEVPEKIVEKARPERAEARAEARVEPRVERPRPVERPTERPTAREARIVAPAAPRPVEPVAARVLDEPRPLRVPERVPERVPDLDEDEPTRGNQIPDPPVDAGRRGRFTIQLKAAEEPETAAAYAAELKRAGFSPKVVVEEGVYRVQLGRFESREAARAFQRRFRHESGRADAGFVTEL